MRGINYRYVITMKSGRCEIGIDRGSDTANDDIFNQLEANQAEIEQSFGHPLIWDANPKHRSARIYYVIEEGGLETRQLWDGLQDQMIAAMIKLSSAFQPFINNLVLE